MTIFKATQTLLATPVKPIIKIHKLTTQPQHSRTTVPITLHDTQTLNTLVRDKLNNAVDTVQVNDIKACSKYSKQYNKAVQQLVQHCTNNCNTLQQAIVQLNQYYNISNKYLQNELDKIIQHYIELHKHTVQHYTVRIWITKHDSESKPEHNNSKNITENNKNTKRKRKRSNFTPEVVAILKDWYDNNQYDCYPNHETKFQLMKLTKLSYEQVSNWFINLRQRQAKAKPTKRIKQSTDQSNAANNNTTVNKQMENKNRQTVIPLQYNLFNECTNSNDNSIANAISLINNGNAVTNSQLFLNSFNNSLSLKNELMNSNNVDNNSVPTFLRPISYTNAVRAVNGMYSPCSTNQHNYDTSISIGSTMSTNNTYTVNGNTSPAFNTLRRTSLTQFNTFSLLNSLNNSNFNTTMPDLPPVNSLTNTLMTFPSPVMSSKSVFAN